MKKIKLLVLAVFATVALQAAQDFNDSSPYRTVSAISANGGSPFFQDLPANGGGEYAQQDGQGLSPVELGHTSCCGKEQDGGCQECCVVAKGCIATWAKIRILTTF